MRTSPRRWAVGALGLGLALSLPAETALACEPPPPNVIRLSPFVTQGQALLPAKDRPLLPRNVDFAIAVLHAQGVDLSAFRLRPDYPLKTEKELPLRAEAQGDEIRVTVRATQPLRAGVGYSVYGVLSGKRQRILQFHTRPAEDRTPPSAVQVTPKAHLGRFTPVLGLCDDGHPRLFLSVQATDDSTRADHLRYLLEGAGQPQLLSSWCGLLELRSDGILSAPLRIRAVDLAGNRGPAVSVSAPAMSAGSWDAVRGQRECTQAR